MTKMSEITGLLPLMDDPFTGTDVLIEYVSRVVPSAAFTGAGMGDEPLARRDVVFEAPAEQAQQLAQHMRDIGLDDLAINGERFAPFLEPNQDHERLATPVEYTKDGKPKPPRRQIVEVHHGSTGLECGHIGKRVTALRGRLPDEPKFLACDTCLPMRDRRYLMAGFDDFRNSWIVSQTRQRIKERS